MKGALLFIAAIIFTTSCGSKLHCKDPSISFKASAKLSYQLDKYEKGSSFSNLLESKTSSVDSNKSIEVYEGADWKITVLETSKEYKIEKIYYETFKARMRFGDSHNSPTHCRNSAFATVNGKAYKVAGSSWRYGNSPGPGFDIAIDK